MSISRRDFLRTSAVAAGGMAITPALAEKATPAAFPMRVLARTKERVSIVGFGTATLGSDNTTPEEAERILNFAIDQGITYLDTAPVYGDPKSKYGNSEMKLKPVLRKRRNEVFLVTKVNPQSGQTRDGVLRQLENSLRDLGTDHADAVHIHNLGDWDMSKLSSPDGPLAGLKEARRQGVLRFIGTSGHMRPPRFVTAIETGEFDLVMNALNFADRNTYDFEGLVLPVAKKHGTAVVAMKVLGGATKWQYDGKSKGTLADYHERAIRYSLGLPGVSLAVIGLSNEEEILKAVEVARKYKPLNADQKSALFEEGKKLALARGEYYGPITG